MINQLHSHRIIIGFLSFNACINYTHVLIINEVSVAHFHSRHA